MIITNLHTWLAMIFATSVKIKDRTMDVMLLKGAVLVPHGVPMLTLPLASSMTMWRAFVGVVRVLSANLTSVSWCGDSTIVLGATLNLANA